MDGASFYLLKEKEEEFATIWKQWVRDLKGPGFEEASKEQKKDILYEVELVNYRAMIFRDVNNYIAIKVKEGEDIKYKGAFMQDTEFHKNKSRRAVRLALSEYFVNKVLPEESIPKMDNIYDFCIRQKASKDFFYKLIKNGEEVELDQMVRYFASKEGHQLLKIKSESCETKAVKQANCEAEDDFGYQPLIKEVNRIDKDKEEQYLKELDTWYYVDKAYSIIDPLEGRRFRSRRPATVPQLTLFG